MNAVPLPLPPPVKAEIVSTAGSFRTMSVNVRTFSRHGREGNVLIALNEAVDAADVLLREKSGVHMPRQVHAKNRGRKGQTEDQQLVAQYPAQTNIVNMQQAVKRSFRKS